MNFQIIFFTSVSMRSERLKKSPLSHFSDFCNSDWTYPKIAYGAMVGKKGSSQDRKRESKQNASGVQTNMMSSYNLTLSWSNFSKPVFISRSVYYFYRKSKVWNVITVFLKSNCRTDFFYSCKIYLPWYTYTIF